MEDTCKICGNEIDCSITCGNCGKDFCEDCGDFLEGLCISCLSEIRVKNLLDKKS